MGIAKTPISTVRDVAASLVNDTLTRVVYEPLLHEATAHDIASDDFFLGAQILLHFERSGAICVSWQSYRCDDPAVAFALYLDPIPAFGPGTVEHYDASHINPWPKFVGQAIRSSSLFGYSETPFVLELSTKSATVYIGCGYERRFGDGDDVHVADAIDESYLTRLHW